GRARWEHAMLLRLRPESAPPRAVADTARSAPFIRLEGRNTLDDVLRSRSGNHRTDVRRRLRRLEGLGPLELKVYEPGEGPSARAELERLRDAHVRLWSGGPSGELFRQPGTFAFYARLLDSVLPLGLLHFSVL